MTLPVAGPVAWPALELEIPATSPAVMATPPMPTWLARARGSRSALDAVTVLVAGVPLGELRRMARREAVDLAVRYTDGLGVAPPAVTTELVLGTGHQPVLVHPGIWIKYLALARLVPADGIGLNLIVDTDAADDITAEVPRDDGRLRRDRLVLAQGGPDVPFEAIPAPTGAQWRVFLEAIDARLGTIGEPSIMEGWTRARGLTPPDAAPGVAGAVTAVRRRLEGPRPYLDLPVSLLAGTRAFRRFAFAILSDARRFAEVYNACLAGYREHYGVRTAAQPFPDLAVNDRRVESPFWHVSGGRRRPLFVDPAGRRLMAGDHDAGVLPGDPEDGAFAQVPIRPRALTLTAFARLAVTDLFIHGIGGGRYDRATDAIVRVFFGIAPPLYATVTATLFLPFIGGGRRDAERQRLRRLLLDLQHNPDRFLEGDGAHRALIQEKWELIRTLEGAGALTRRERRAATQRIREVNQVLGTTVAGRIAEAQEALQRLNRHEEDAEVTAYRGYPFLLHRVEDVDALVDALATAHADALAGEAGS
jgi:hypothetical protein